MLVSLEVEVAEPTPETHQRVIGVDVGQRYLAVVGRLDNGAIFLSRESGAGQSGPLRATEKTVAAQRHPLSDTATGRDRRAGETVEAS